jgi:hypothetical protein
MKALKSFIYYYKVVFMEEIEIPAKYADLVSHYEKCDTKESAIAQEILWQAFTEKIDPRSISQLLEAGNCYGIKEDFTKNQISELQKNGLLETESSGFVNVGHLGSRIFVPRILLTPTEKGRYALYSIISKAHERLNIEWKEKYSEPPKGFVDAMSGLEDENWLSELRDRSNRIARTFKT